MTPESAAILAVVARRVACALEGPILVLASDGGVPVADVHAVFVDDDGAGMVPDEILARAVGLLIRTDRAVVLGEGAAAVLRPGARCGLSWDG